jgi:osmotically-inducible protein OsmY
MMYSNTRTTDGAKSRVALAAVLALAMMLPSSAIADTPTDVQIANAVDDELFLDLAVPHDRIDVSAIDGVVSLTGTVDNQLARDRAATLAGTVRGVRAVVNDIEIEPHWERTDEEIRADVISALAYDPASEAWEIGVTVENQVVTLTGTLDSWQEREHVLRVVKGVRGVVDIDNRIVIDRVTPRTDQDIREDVNTALRWDALVDHELIDVAVDGGTVMLNGTVGSLAEKNRAEVDAWVAGVARVDATGLDVAAWADADRQDEGPPEQLLDIEIERAVRDALILDPKVLSTDVTVESDEGFVTLRGRVDSLREKRAAEQDALLTEGVAGVTNRLKIRPDAEILALTDTEIADEIRDALARNPYVERFDVMVTVEDGIAYLTGTVDTTFEKIEAENAASLAPGVVAVRNDLVVDVDTVAMTYDPYLGDFPITAYDWYQFEPYRTVVSDARILRQIRNELWWSPFVDADEVAVTVSDGVATLTGTVDSFAEMSAATENAYEGGATWVDNDLEVD